MILVIAEHDGNQIKPATLSSVTAAKKLGGDIHLAVLGKLPAKAATIEGVAKVLHSEHEAFTHGLAEHQAKTLAAIGKNYTHIVAPATSYGKNLLPRLAALLDSQAVSDISGIETPDTFIRPIYAGNAIATVQSFDAVKCLTIRPTAFAGAAMDKTNAPVEKFPAILAGRAAKFVKLEASISARPDLTAANIVVSGGRGLGSAENFKMLEKLADQLGAAIGASRAAVDAGFVPNDYQVGQTGKVVAPKLYIAVGISGAIQHLAGMKDSKVIVAINKDGEAPIFQIADFGLVQDLFTALPELTAALAKRKAA
ncbi:MAG: electron transfer flavoprotein subunit alpha/FixB family protein [Dongiaceae bacterium]